MAKEYKYRGKSVEELQAMGLNELANQFKSRARRTIKRGFSDEQKKLLEKVRLMQEGKRKKMIKTHLRDMLILPEMVGIKISVHSGKEFIPVEITIEKVGHYLGEFVMTRKEVTHKAPGVGATRSSKHASVK